MSEFRRGFDERGFEALEAALQRPRHWWRDLLGLWRPSGHPSVDGGLRLAIRNGYMNLYRCGQSVARVALNAKRQPCLKVHAKYVLPEAQLHMPGGDEYVKLVEDTIVRPSGLPSLPYEGAGTLRSWVARIEKEFVDKEKPQIDRLLGVMANDGVIDLEMGLPAWGDQVSAPRIDLVAIERAKGCLVLYFGDVKLVDDGRIRSRSPVIPDKNPEVLEQLSLYRKYLEVAEHRKLVAEQYACAARLLKRLHEAAAKADIHVPPLGQAILDAASGQNISVEKVPRLIVVNNPAANQSAWREHRDKLETEKERAPMIVVDGPVPLRFGDWP